MPGSHSVRRVRALSRCKKGQAMPRRNQGPRLRWLAKRQSFYITWTEHGRSRERATGTPDRAQAEIAFAEWMQRRGRREGPCDPAAILVTEVLNEYQEQRGPKI